MQGFLWDGSNFIDPNTNLPTHFCLAGDPVEGTGWYEGLGWPGGPVPSDRRFLLSTGKFNMAAGDTQEVVIAYLVKKGTDNINSITELKNYATQIQNWYNNDFVTSIKSGDLTIPLEFSLSQNYPNPFNPSTKIKYSIPSANSPLLGGARGGLVTLKVYDILGNEIATLVNEEKPAGNYEVEFSAAGGPASSIKHLASGIGYASGVYFYRLRVGNFVQTKKMIFAK
jgi:hypothetical protein